MSEGHAAPSPAAQPAAAPAVDQIEELARQYGVRGKRDRDIELLAQMLVRSYDPCISCATHFLKLDIERED